MVGLELGCGLVGAVGLDNQLGVCGCVCDV